MAAVVTASPPAAGSPTTGAPAAGSRRRGRGPRRRRSGPPTSTPSGRANTNDSAATGSFTVTFERSSVITAARSPPGVRAQYWNRCGNRRSASKRMVTPSGVSPAARSSAADRASAVHGPDSTANRRPADRFAPRRFPLHRPPERHQQPRESPARQVGRQSGRVRGGPGGGLPHGADVPPRHRRPAGDAVAGVQHLPVADLRQGQPGRRGLLLFYAPRFVFYVPRFVARFGGQIGGGEFEADPAAVGQQQGAGQLEPLAAQLRPLPERRPDRPVAGEPVAGGIEQVRGGRGVRIGDGRGRGRTVRGRSRGSGTVRGGRGGEQVQAGQHERGGGGGVERSRAGRGAVGPFFGMWATGPKNWTAAVRSHECGPSGRTGRTGSLRRAGGGGRDGIPATPGGRPRFAPSEPTRRAGTPRARPPAGSSRTDAPAPGDTAPGLRGYRPGRGSRP